MAFRNRIRLNISIKCSLIVYCGLIAIILAVRGSSSLATGEEYEPKDGENVSKLRKLLEWDNYKKIFNKRYSTTLQMTERQKIYLARAMDVFKKSLLYMMDMQDYYTAINKFSDRADEELYQISYGERNADYDPHIPFTDDYEAGEILLNSIMGPPDPDTDPVVVLIDQDNLEFELVKKREEALRKYKEQTRGKRRRKREVNHKLNINDIIKKDASPGVVPDYIQQLQPVIPPQNPNYEPHQSVPMKHIAPVAGDIHPSGYRIGGLLSSSLAYLKSTIERLYAQVSAKIELTEEQEVVDDKADRRKDTVVINDWRSSGCIGQVMNQEACNCPPSCYAMSTTSFMEWALCMNQNHTLTPLSVQYTVSCGNQYRRESGGKIRLNGCSSGSSKNAIDFVREYGLELGSNLDYYDAETECPIKPETPRKKKGYIRPNVGNPIRLSARTNRLDLALKVGPVIVSMTVPEDFIYYAGGIIDNCKGSTNGHSMLIVGNAVEENTEYMIIKNSYGTGWGYGGYAKFKRSALIECVKEFISPQVNFPSEKSNQRRMKAYLSSKAGPDNQEEQDVLGSEIVALYDKDYGERSYFPYR